MLNGLPAASEFAVLAHEFAHELLHRSGDPPESRDTRELEAEAVAFVVGQAVGLEAAEAAVTTFSCIAEMQQRWQRRWIGLSEPLRLFLQSIQPDDKAISDAA